MKNTGTFKDGTVLLNYQDGTSAKFTTKIFLERFAGDIMCPYLDCGCKGCDCERWIFSQESMDFGTCLNVIAPHVSKEKRVRSRS